MTRASLLEDVQAVLERTYRMHTGVADIGRFVIGDVGYRELYRESAVTASTGEAESTGMGARTLIRDTSEGLRVCIYYPDAMIQRLEAHPPQRGVTDDNVDAFAVLVEEVDHLLCVAERAWEGRAVSLFELELHANVSKHMVLARFVAGRRRALDERRRTWLKYHLFHKASPADADLEVRGRYRDAARWALRFVEAGRRLAPARRIDLLRRFHVAGSAGKIELIGRLAARHDRP